ncbi:uncharacterized protein LOC111715777 [Eurytemora carolleeae]|uniref:uncharacterized protein LOC111715777 n=1 Tax=Eurytemora carolleeae TaxID=1294199 RepID=UPI000C7724FB|nr:uncharacterized protein LOC111715777 [Eurytemora carolleeae]|eukprot:XP_023346912.1 uncharacterized protein LOC111715777 [Eurytemora affinis]
MSLPQETSTIVATVVEEILVDVIIVDKDSKLHIAKGCSDRVIIGRTYKFYRVQGHARDDSWEFLHEFPLCLDTVDPPVYTLDEEFKEELARFKREVAESMGHHYHKVPVDGGEPGLTKDSEDSTENKEPFFLDEDVGTMHYNG